MEFKKFILANGLPVYTKYIPNKKTISCGIRINQGAKDETNETNGLSHLTEHLAFKIKNKDSQTSIAANSRSLEENGISYNATTYKESTFFYLQGLSSEIEGMIENLSYLVVNKDKVTAEDLEKEKKVVLREAEAYFGSTGQIADRIGQALWGNNQHGRMVIGTLENIKSFTAKMVDDLIENTYTPDNSAIMIVGDFQSEVLEMLLKKYFDRWKGTCKQKTPIKVNLTPDVMVHNEYCGKRTTVGLGFQTYPLLNEKYPYIELIKNYFPLSQSSIMQELREKRGLLYGMKSYTKAFSLTGNIGIAFTANNEDVIEILKVMLAELQKLSETGIDKGLLNCLKKRRKIELLAAIERSEEQIKILSEYASKGKIYDLQKEIEKINTMSLEETNQVLKETFNLKNIGISILGDQNRDEVLSLLKDFRG